MMRYQLYLKNQKVKTYRLISDLIVVINAIFLAYVVFNTTIQLAGQIMVTVCLLFSGFYLAFQVVERIRNKPVPDTWSRSIFIFSALAWAKTEWWWIGFTLLFFALLDYLSTRKMVVKISQQSIQYPSFPQKDIQWKELSNVVLKDGLLTIDFKNNRLIQQAILNSDWDINEAEFNSFCQRRLESASVPTA